MVGAALGLIALGFVLLLLPLKANGEEPQKIVLSAERWTTTGGVDFVKHNGMDAMNLKAGNYAQHVPTGRAVLNDLVFSNGTIEFDIEATAGMGGGFGFRRRDDKTFEDFYLRAKPNCDQAFDCIQYTPQTHGVLLWDVYPRYQAPAPVKIGEWNHVKLVVSGHRMNIFINGEKSPSLNVGRLEGDTTEGGIELEGPAFFANLTIAPNAVEGLSPQPEKDKTDTDLGFVRNWQLSPFSELAADKEPALADLPDASAAWQSLTAERAGLVNISRVYGIPLDRPKLALAWLKTSIHSDQEQTQKVNFGWVREAWVFVNGKPVYADKNLYQPPSARKEPDGRCAIENGSFLLPLKQGDNDVVVAVANNFYGWGIIFHLDDVNGIRLKQ
jgi:hypothetical protein